MIERPASVVKELLENSIDAGSQRIDIDVEQGGAELIRVVDNGCGILPEDLALAFANHATSKLTTADDLFAVHSLGFRGEALASIAGVSQVSLQSRTAERPEGAAIVCHGGELSEVKAWNGGGGTRIEVRHLFYNTPVRRKFLRTPATEIGHICEICTRIALARPNLQLVLRHNDKNVHEIPAGARLQERIRLFFGDEVSDKLYAIDAELGPARLFGYIADPACERGNARTQYLFVNGRWIRDRSLGHALQEGYRGLIMTGRYAVAFLFLELPPDQVDVNVHPTKAEVRFRDAQALYSLVLATVRDRLRAENLTARIRPPSMFSAPNEQGGVPLFQPRPSEISGSLFPPRDAARAFALAMILTVRLRASKPQAANDSPTAHASTDFQNPATAQRLSRSGNRRRHVDRRSARPARTHSVRAVQGTLAGRHAGNAAAADSGAGGTDGRASRTHAGIPGRAGGTGPGRGRLRRQHRACDQLSDTARRDGRRRKSCAASSII